MLVQKVWKWMVPLEENTELRNNSIQSTKSKRFSPHTSSSTSTAATSLLTRGSEFDESNFDDFGKLANDDCRSPVSFACNSDGNSFVKSSLVPSVVDVGVDGIEKDRYGKNTSTLTMEKIEAISMGAGDGKEISQGVLQSRKQSPASKKSISTQTEKTNSKRRRDVIKKIIPKKDVQCELGASTANVTRECEKVPEVLVKESVDEVPSRVESQGPTYPKLEKDEMSDEEVPQAVVYGELAVLGCNGQPPHHLSGLMKSRFRLTRRFKANGVKEAFSFVSTLKHPIPRGSGKHAVLYRMAAGRSVVVEYMRDKDTDMFQIGRFETAPVDFRVLDVNRSRNGVSRFACRIVVQRRGAHEARVYAAAFDPTGHIFLGEGALTCVRDGKMDGFTTNGVLIMHPKTQPLWREVSVCGFVYPLRSATVDPRERPRVPDESNVLQDGTLIDLCGVTLVWRSPAGLWKTPGRSTLCKIGRELQSWTPQYEIPPETLFETTRKERRSLPVVFQSCGHVVNLFGHLKTDSLQSWPCPVCAAVGPVSKLEVGVEPGFYADCGYLSHAFRPCGHATTLKTVLYWSAIKIPEHRCFQEGLCPFCGVKLDSVSKYVELKYPE